MTEHEARTGDKTMHDEAERPALVGGEDGRSLIAKWRTLGLAGTYGGVADLDVGGVTLRLSYGEACIVDGIIRRVRDDLAALSLTAAQDGERDVELTRMANRLRELGREDAAHVITEGLALEVGQKLQVAVAVCPADTDPLGISEDLSRLARSDAFSYEDLTTGLAEGFTPNAIRGDKGAEAVDEHDPDECVLCSSNEPCGEVKPEISDLTDALMQVADALNCDRSLPDILEAIADLQGAR